MFFRFPFGRFSPHFCCPWLNLRSTWRSHTDESCCDLGFKILCVVLGRQWAKLFKEIKRMAESRPFREWTWLSAVFAQHCKVHWCHRGQKDHRQTMGVAPSGVLSRIRPLNGNVVAQVWGDFTPQRRCHLPSGCFKCLLVVVLVQSCSFLTSTHWTSLNQELIQTKTHGFKASLKYTHGLGLSSYL